MSAADAELAALEAAVPKFTAAYGDSNFTLALHDNVTPVYWGQNLTLETVDNKPLNITAGAGELVAFTDYSDGVGSYLQADRANYANVVTLEAFDYYSDTNFAVFSSGIAAGVGKVYVARRDQADALKAATTEDEYLAAINSGYVVVFTVTVPDEFTPDQAPTEEDRLLTEVSS